MGRLLLTLVVPTPKLFVHRALNRLSHLSSFSVFIRLFFGYSTQLLNLWWWEKRNHHLSYRIISERSILSLGTDKTSIFIVTKIFKETHQPIIIYPNLHLKLRIKNQYESSFFSLFFIFFFFDIARFDALT